MIDLCNAMAQWGRWHCIYSFPTCVALDVFYTTFNEYTKVFPQRKENSVNSRNLKNCLSMNRGQFKDPVTHMCLTGAGGVRAGGGAYLCNSMLLVRRGLTICVVKCSYFLERHCVSKINAPLLLGSSHQSLKVCEVKCVPGDPTTTCPVLF